MTAALHRSDWPATRTKAFRAAPANTPQDVKEERSSAFRIRELLQQRFQPLPGRCQPLLHVVIHKLVSRADGLAQGDFGLLMDGLKLLPPRLILHPSDQRSGRFHRVAGFVKLTVKRSRRFRPLQPRRGSACAVALPARGLQRFSGWPPGTGGVVAQGTYRNPRITLFQQREVLALLKRHKRSGVTGAAGGGKITTIHGAGGISAVQNPAMGQQRLECCSVTAVTFLATHIRALMRGEVPIGEMVYRGSGQTGEVAFGASALRRGLRRQRQEQRGAQVDGNSGSLHLPVPYPLFGLTAP